MKKSALWISILMMVISINAQAQKGRSDTTIEIVPSIQIINEDTVVRSLELKFAKIAVTSGHLGYVNGYIPSAEFSNDSITVEVLFTSSKRDTPYDFLIMKGDRLFLDSDMDGIIDVVYVNKTPGGLSSSDHKATAELKIRVGSVTDTEIDLEESMQSMGANEFALFNAKTKMYYSTVKGGKGSMSFPKEDEEKMLNSLQGKFLKALTLK